jgi:hypothetical protein
METYESVRDLYPRLVDGDIGVLSSFGERATVDSPLGGRQLPPEFVAETRAWLARHDASCTLGRAIVTESRVAQELTLTLSLDGQACELPVLLVADIDGEDVRDLRIYHSTWPLNGHHGVRHPVFNAYDADLGSGTMAQELVEAIAAGDAHSADELFALDGAVTDARGAQYAHAGSERTAWLGRVLADGGWGIRLGAVADDGGSFVAEFLVDRIGAHAVPAQAGALVGVVADGRLAAVRLYDDLTLSA